MSTNDWAQRLIDDTTDVLDGVVPPRFAPAAKALVEATLTTLPVGAQLLGELADRGPREISGAVEKVPSVAGPAAPADVKLTIGKGGDGGTRAGEIGGKGGNGGAGGPGVGGTLDTCNGGKGGHGADGGAGGGGRGGHSLGIAYVTAAPSGGFTVVHGSGGLAGMTMGAGMPADPGVAQDTLQLGAN
ncbi:MAG: hypothetical protein U0414_22030 [Polyangiaceae bacterium]